MSAKDSIKNRTLDHHLTPNPEPLTPRSRSAEIAATVADPSPVLQLIVVSAVEILQGAAGVIALLEDDRLVPRASYGLPAGALASLHPRLDRAILNVLGQLGECPAHRLLRELG